MKFCPVVPEICHVQVHGSQKERRRKIIIIRRNGAKTLFGRLNNNYLPFQILDSNHIPSCTSAGSVLQQCKAS
jgi:hypothetical protein